MLLLQVFLNSLVSLIQVLLLAAGLYLVYTVTRIFHVGLIAIVIVGAYLLYFFKEAGFALEYGIILSLLGSGLLGWLSYFLLRDMAKKKQPLLGLLLSITFWLLLEALVAITFGSDGKFIYEGVIPNYYFAGLQITSTGVVNLAVGAALVLLASFVIYGLPVGRILRATHQHPECANLSGIKVGTVQSWTFIIAGVLAGTTGILVGINRAIVPTSFTSILVVAFMSFIVGGVNNFRGTIVATIVLVTIPELFISLPLGAVSIPASWGMVITFVLAMMMLYFKPEGIFYQQTRKS